MKYSGKLWPIPSILGSHKTAGDRSGADSIHFVNKTQMAGLGVWVQSQSPRVSQKGPQLGHWAGHALRPRRSSVLSLTSSLTQVTY